MSNENKILHKELSYKLQGIIFDIRNDLGSGHKESIYQKALEKELTKAGIKFIKEPSIKIYSKKGEFLGLYRPDFLIDDKIIVELKAVEHISRQETARVYDYLRNSKYELAYLVNFAALKLYVKRFLFTNDKKNWIKNLVIVFVAISTLFVGIRGIYAAQMSFEAKTARAQIGEKFEMKLLVNAEQESINAFEGKVVFPRDILDLKEIRDGNSIVNFWIEKPNIPRMATNNTTNNNELIFSGITPGGYTGKNGLIFTMVFEAKNEGAGSIEIQNARILLNDGTGTSAKLSVGNFSFVAIRTPIRDDLWVSPKDTERPESFVPEIAKDETLFDGKWFVVFATQDKASGVDHYEIKESRQRILSMFKKWISAESPHILRDQELRSFVFVKAVDKAGNERIIKIAPRNPLAWYENYENWIIIIVVIIFSFFITKRNLWKKLLPH